MQAGLRIGTLFGIPLFLDSSWFVILVLFTFINYQSYQGLGFDQSTAFVGGLIIALSLFGSVFLHELGHSLTALSQGIKVNSITLYFFGGIASIERESTTPGGAFQVAIAGPLVNVALFFILSFAGHVLTTGTLIERILDDLAGINLVLAIFNLIPGLPLDGGQVLKALIWKITGNRFTAIRWAAQAGQMLGWFAIALGVSLFLGVITGGRSAPGGLWLALIGWFIVSNATVYTRVANLQEVLSQLKAVDVMTREFRVIDANLSLRQFADQYLLEESHFPFYFAASEGRYRGLVSLDNLRLVERSQWESLTLQRIAQPFSEIVTVPEKASLIRVINALETHQLKSLTVLSPADAVAGVIDRGDIVRAVCEKLKTRISSGDIKRIKDEGTYPPGFPLNVIAKTMANEAD